MTRVVRILLLRDADFWKRNVWRRRLRWAAAAGYLYLAVLVGLLALENVLLYPGAVFDRSDKPPPADLAVQDVWFETGHERIHGWFLTPPGWEPSRGAILLSHGNGRNLSALGGKASRWRDQLGYAVLLYDYPGYGRSTGTASEAGCYRAGEAAYGWLVGERRVPEERVILMGHSLGGAIATELATRHDAELLVLHGAFTSFPDMAQHRFPMFPGRYLVRNRMDNEHKVGDVRCPVFLSHGTSDTVVPFRQGERLYNAAHEPKRFYRVEGGKHAEPSDVAYFAAVKAFLAETSRQCRLHDEAAP